MTTILTDEELNKCSLAQGFHLTAHLRDFAREVESAILARQREQAAPVAWCDVNRISFVGGALRETAHSDFSSYHCVPLFAAPVVQPDDLKDAERLKRMAEIYAMERDNARSQYQRVVHILTGIHALLYPPHYTDMDGRTWQFKSPLVEEQMQALSDRIRAIPDEIAAIDAAMAAEKEG